MTLYGRSSRWGLALALGLAGLVGVSAALVLAAPARTAATAFELTLETALTPPLFMSTEGGTFRSREPFCASGNFVEFDNAIETVKWRFTCDDGTGSLTVGLLSDATWRILDGRGSYAGLLGRGSVRGEQLCKPWLGENCDFGKPIPWRGTLQGFVDWSAEPDQPEAAPDQPENRDTVAPTIAFSSTTATKLRAGTYVIKVALALRDDVEGNPVSYRLRVASARGSELARRFCTATTEGVSMTLRIRPPDGARLVRLQLTGVDPAGNAVSVRRAVSLPR